MRTQASLLLFTLGSLLLSACASMGDVSTESAPQQDAEFGAGGAGGAAVPSGSSGSSGAPGKGTGGAAGGGIQTGTGGSMDNSPGGAAGAQAGTNGGESAGGGVGASGQAGAAGATGVPPSAQLPEACRSCLEALCDLCPQGAQGCDPCAENPDLCLPTGPQDAAKQCACGGCMEQCGQTVICTNANNAAGGAGGASGGGANGGGGGSDPCPQCPQGNVEECTNGKDDDGDGSVDCLDADCETSCLDACHAPTKLTLTAQQPTLTLTALLAGHADTFAPNCVLASETGPDLGYAITAEKAGVLTVSVASLQDIALSLRKDCGGPQADVQCRNQTGAGGAESLVVPVKQGETWFVVVGGAEPGGATFDLTASLTSPECGDGVVDAAEDCDDGNQLDDDGCSAKCKLTLCDLNAETIDDGLAGTLAGSTSGGTSLLQPSCSKLSSPAKEKVFSLRAAHTGRLVATLRSAQNADLNLSVRTSCASSQGEVACADGSPGQAGAVERVSLPSVEGQTFYLVVDGYESAQEGAFELFARTYPLLCGDDRVGPTEQCEKSLSGGCGTDCTFDLPPGVPAETEGNNSPAEATPLQGEIVGKISPSGDTDWYRVTLGAPGSLKASIDDNGKGGCAAGGDLEGGLDSELRLYAADGVALLASSDNAPGRGLCSQIDAGLAAGTYYLQVRASTSGSPEQVFSYKLTATTQ